MIDSIVNELLMASRILHTNKVSRIAEEIGYKPILIINAMYRGAETGKLTYDKKHDTLTISPDVEVEHLGVSEGMSELSEQVELLITYLNGEEKDMSIEELRLFLGGQTPELHVKIAVMASTNLATYEIADPKDKESVYTFITLKENRLRKWGTKQFDASKSKAKKRAAKAE